jgi:hypothetical protein
MGVGAGGSAIAHVTIMPGGADILVFAQKAAWPSCSVQATASSSSANS